MCCEKMIIFKKIQNLSLSDISKLSEKITLYALFLNAALHAVSYPFSAVMLVSVIIFILADTLLLIRILIKKEKML